MFKTIFAGLLRHLLTTLGGSVVAQGLITGDQLSQAVGAATALAGVAASVYSKVKEIKALKEAKVEAPKFNS